MKQSKQSTTRRTLHWFWQFTRSSRLFFIESTVGSALGTICQDIIPPLVVSRAFTLLQAKAAAHQQITFTALRPYVIAFAAFQLAGFVIWRLQVIAAWLLETRAIQEAMEYIFNHLQIQSNAFHANRFGGALVSQANKFVGGYEKLMDNYCWSIVNGATAFIATLAVLFATMPRYGLVLLIGCLAYFYIMGGRIYRQLPLDRALATSESDRTAKLADNVTNTPSVRAFAGEETENVLFHDQTEQTRKATFRLMNVAMKNDVINSAWINTMTILAFAGGLLAVTNFTAPIGLLYLAVTYTIALSNRMWQARQVLKDINRSLGDASDMTHILDLEPEIKDIDSPEPFKIKNGSISFKDVTFAYSDGNGRAVFSNLNLEIPAGQKVGLVGPSGGGKTTITKLVMRFMDIQKGSISIDGQDIAKIKQVELRRNITSVPQESLLFHRSIADNIRYGNPKASSKEVRQAAKFAHADEFIKQLPQGYDTLVGERGVKLSGGQRQRVAIARAMLRPAPILILDEATSALDSESEKLIQDALWKLMENRTSIVVAHRLSTIQHMDRIVVIEDGKIVEDGSHHDLLRKKGLYARLWAHQSGGFLEE